MTDILKSQMMLVASTTDVTGSAIQVSNCQTVSVTVRASVTAATLSATVAIGGTNADPEASSFPALVTGKLVTALPSGVTFDAATGVLTFATAAIGVHEITIAYTEFPKWVRAAYDYTSGGGTVDVQIVLGAWSV